MVGGSFGASTDVKQLASDKRIKMGFSDVKVLGIIIGNMDGITFGIDVGTELGCLGRYFCGSNDGNLDGLLNGVSLRSTDGNFFGCDEVIKLELSDGKVHETVLGNVDRIKWNLLMVK